jgi:hypothetical protein
MRLLQRATTPCFAACLLLFGACATVQESTGPAGAQNKPAPPVRYNLAGYSTAFKQGYADACATPRRQNAGRFRSDTDYSMGWTDGSTACRAR